MNIGATGGSHQTAANLAMAAAAGIAVYMILVTPALRRIAGQFLRRSATGTLPAVLASEMSRAWGPSGHRA